jgi:hypothetical protein
LEKQFRFTKGLAGWLARFYIRRRQGRDPFDETLILPSILSVIALRLNEVGTLSDLQSFLIYAFSVFFSGVYLGFSVGGVGNLRAALRGFAIGAIISSAYSALSATLSRSQALELSANIVYLSYVFFWFGHLLSAMVGDFVTVSKDDWDAAAPRRAWLAKYARAILGGEEGKDLSTPMLLSVRATQIFGPPAALAWLSWVFLDVNPIVTIKDQLLGLLSKPGS